MNLEHLKSSPEWCTAVSVDDSGLEAMPIRIENLAQAASVNSNRRCLSVPCELGTDYQAGDEERVRPAASGHAP